MTHTEKYLFTKSAFLGIGKALSSFDKSSLGKTLSNWGLNPREIMQLAKHTTPRTAAVGSGVGGLGNVMLGDESQSTTERLLKGLLYGGIGGAAAGVPIAAAGNVAGHTYVNMLIKVLKDGFKDKTQQKAIVDTLKADK